MKNTIAKYKSVGNPAASIRKVSSGIGSVPMAALLALLSSAYPAMAGTTPVELGAAGGFVILSTSGVTDVSPSNVVGDVGTSPITGAAITATDGNFCDEVTGTIYTVDASGPACSVADATFLGAAVGDMMLAYDDAALRAPTHPPELGAGDISGMTLAPGVWKWSSPVAINSDVTLSGGRNDVWVFQIAGTLDIASGGDLASGIKVNLTGGAKASNVYWQVAGATTLGTYSTFSGTILDQSNIALQTGAVLNGRALAQTAVTLQQNTITTTQTRGECEDYLKAEKRAFDDGQKAEKKAFDDGQKAEKKAFNLTLPTSAQKKVFEAVQKADKQAFGAEQKADKQAFAAKQASDQEECNTLE